MAIGLHLPNVVQIVEAKNQALGRVLRNKFLGTPSHLGNFVRESFSGKKGAKGVSRSSIAVKEPAASGEILQRVPVVAPAGSEPWGWQLLRFTNVSFGEALYGRPGVRSKVASACKEPVAPKSVLRDLFSGRIGKGIAITASASGIGTGAPFAVYPFREGTGLVSSSTER